MRKQARTYPYEAITATALLRQRDPQLGALMDQVGPYRLKLQDNKTPFQALLRSIIYQQLSGRAAGSIHNRVLSLFPHRYASPARLLQIRDTALLSAGLSRAKVKAVNDLAERYIGGHVPRSQQLKHMADEEVISNLRQIRGVGVWTAEMLLIFNLARPDVLPAGDLGVQKGFRMAYGLRKNPDPKRLLRHGERWRPYRTVATWYLWQANYL